MLRTLLSVFFHIESEQSGAPLEQDVVDLMHSAYTSKVAISGIASLETEPQCLFCPFLSLCAAHLSQLRSHPEHTVALPDHFSSTP